MKRSSVENAVFVPREWNQYFSSLSTDERRTGSAGVCRAVLTVCPLDDPPLHEALRALEPGTRQFGQYPSGDKWIFNIFRK